ncbi:hypothetical protein V8C26DRAFT_332562 [Trichoderma gracile]
MRIEYRGAWHRRRWLALHWAVPQIWRGKKEKRGSKALLEQTKQHRKKREETQLTLIFLLPLSSASLALSPLSLSLINQTGNGEILGWICGSYDDCDGIYELGLDGVWIFSFLFVPSLFSLSMLSLSWFLFVIFLDSFWLGNKWGASFFLVVISGDFCVALSLLVIGVALEWTWIAEDIDLCVSFHTWGIAILGSDQNIYIRKKRLETPVWDNLRVTVMRCVPVNKDYLPRGH